MRQQIAITLQIVLVLGGKTVLGWSQTPISPTPGAPIIPVVEVVAAPTGAFVPTAGTGFGSVALGHISWVPQNQQSGLRHAKDGNSFTITTSVGLRLDCPPADSGRRASIAAVLQQPDPRYVISLDEVTLSTAPATISPLVFCGSTTPHTLAVRVPVSASAGSINTNVRFEVTLR